MNHEDLKNKIEELNKDIKDQNLFAWIAFILSLISVVSALIGFGVI